MSHIKQTRKLNNGEQVLMREWAANYGKAVRQRTVRQETTMFKAGTLPLNMYATSVPQNEEVRFPQTRPLEASDVEKEHEEVQSKLSEEGGSDTEDAEQESEYDAESESEEKAVNLDDNEDEMTFLRAVTTSGRMVKVTSKFF